MRFMTLVMGKEDQGFPPPSLFEAIGKLEKDARAAGPQRETRVGRVVAVRGLDSTQRVRSNSGAVSAQLRPAPQADDA